MAARYSETIISADSDDGQVIIRWADDHVSRFHPIWLRDNCFCEFCGDTWTGKRFVMLTDFEAKPKPQRVFLNDNGCVEITWAGDRHESAYDAGWLRRHCYSDRARSQRRFHPILWDRSLSRRLPSIDFDAATADPNARLRLFSHLRDYGIVRLRGVPSSMAGSRTSGELFGDLQDYGYGAIQDLSSFVDYTGDETDTIDTDTGTYQVTLPTSRPVPPHNDQIFHHAHPGILFFHCVEPNPEGGGASVMVDGFNVAEDLRRTEPAAFELLSRIPQTFTRYISDRDASGGGFGRSVDFRGGGRAICLDVDDQVVGFRYHGRATAPLDLPESLIEPMYTANRALVERINDPQFQARFSLAAGDVLVLDNHRVLHAREGFRGRRHLRLYQVAREEFHSRLRTLARQLGADGADWPLPGGALG